MSLAVGGYDLGDVYIRVWLLGADLGNVNIRVWLLGASSSLFLSLFAMFIFFYFRAVLAGLILTL